MLFPLLILLLLLYITYDVNYFIRAGVAGFIAKFFRKELKNFTEPSVIYGIVLPVDTGMLHMNSSRYLRENDFGRLDHGIRTGFIKAMLLQFGSFPVIATTIRYRVPIKMFSFYKVVTRPVFWDSKSIVLAHRMVTLRDEVVRSFGYTRVACVNFNGEKTIKKLYPNVIKPEMTEDVRKWIESCNASSNMLHKTKSKHKANKT